MRIWWTCVVLTVVAGGCGAMGGSAFGGSDVSHSAIKFRWAPPTPISFKRAYVGDVDFYLGPEKQVHMTREFKFDVSVQRRGDGYSVKVRPERMVVEHEGKPVNDPMLDLDRQTVVIYALDHEGIAHRVVGYDNHAAEMKKRLPPDQIQAMTGGGNPTAELIRSAKEVWAAMRGYYVGHTLTIGTPMYTTVEMSLGVMEQAEPYMTECKLMAVEGEGKKLRAKVLCRGATSAAMFETTFSEPYEGPTGPKPSQDRTHDGAVWSQKWVDPRTGLVYEEASRHVIVPKGKPTGFPRRVESRTYQMAY